MQTYDSRLYRLKGPSIYALYRIKYSTNNLRGINNYKPLKLILEMMLAYPYAYGYS
jgi:hypothetical protein